MKKLFVLISALSLITAVFYFHQGAYAMDNKKVVLETNQGEIEIELLPQAAPKAYVE